jgi:hypothetical protein
LEKQKGEWKLNLNNNPSIKQLRELLQSCDDTAGSHVLWVDHQGTVHITLLDRKITPAVWAENMKDQIRFRYETYGRGNDYVGLEAAQDDEYVSSLFHKLLKDWQEEERGYLDI